MKGSQQSKCIVVVRTNLECIQSCTPYKCSFHWYIMHVVDRHMRGMLNTPEFRYCNDFIGP